jgi:O-acetylserine/cysteine efflux transporter
MQPLDWAATITVIVLWAFNFVVAKIGVTQFPPLLFLALRFALVALLLAPYLRRPLPPWRGMITLSIVLGGLHFGLLFAGLRGVDAGPAAVAIQLSIPFSSLLALFIYGEQLRPAQVAGLAIAFAGVYVMGGEPASQVSAPHLIMVVGGALAWAVANVVIKRLGPLDPMVINAWFGALTAPQMLIASLVLERGQLAAIAGADRFGWAAVVYTAVAASIVAYGLWYRLIRAHPVNRVVPPTLLAPVLAMGFAAWLLEEPLTARTVGGGLLTLGGVAMVQFMGRRATATRSPP